MAESDLQRVRELYQQAAKLYGAKRAAFLDSACSGNPQLRESVEELLRKNSDVTQTMLRRDTAKIQLDQTKVEPKGSMVGRITAQFRKRRRWHWVLLTAAACLLPLIAAWVYWSIHLSVENAMRGSLQAILDQQVIALRSWLATESELVLSWSRTAELRGNLTELRELAERSEQPEVDLARTELRLELRKIINELSGADSGVRYAVWSRERMHIADSDEQSPTLGNTVTPLGGSILARSFGGESVLWLPTTSGFITKGFTPPKVVAKPGIAIIVPVFAVGDQSRPIASLMIAGRGMQEQFEAIIQSARFGETGETYAVDERGLLITESRFLDQLLSAGLIPAGENSFSAQTVRVADPGGNINSGFKPKPEYKEEWPLTLAAAATVAGRKGDDFKGYVDYRGVKVVGTWEWLKEYGFGVISEVDYDDAFAPLVPLRRAYNFLIGLLGLSLIGFAVVTRALLQARQQADMSKQIGPYTIEKLIGEGGLGQVFLANHSLLKRPAAIKVLKPEAVTEKNQRRFEREIRMASSLRHPNTIAIYDYGQTPEGGFYSAMEYVDGLTLAQIIELDGPQKPERVVWILCEVCRSLLEAHSKGMVHRDIKPQNIMLSCQGGEADTVKVLDFGLALETSTSRSRVTETQILVGTPMYISPERIANPQCIDPRSDIYSLGVVAFVLLTGREPYEAKNALEALSVTVREKPPHASEFAPFQVPPKLDRVVYQCQLKDLESRTRSIAELHRQLTAIADDLPWTRDDAAAWWWSHARDFAERCRLRILGK